MKKSTLALMVMSVVASASVHAAEVYNKNGNKLDVYGKVKAMHYFSDDTSNDGDKTYVRFGFKGETQINDQLTGYGRWEAEFAGNNDEATSGQKTRLAFAGLKMKDFGSVDYGRNLGVLYDVAAVTDMFPEFGGDGLARTDNFMTKRTTGVQLTATPTSSVWLTVWICPCNTRVKTKTAAAASSNRTVTAGVLLWRTISAAARLR